MITASMATTMAGIISDILGVLFAPTLAILMVLLEIIGRLVITVFYYPLVALLKLEAQLVTGSILQSLYTDALGLANNGIIGPALKGLLVITGDIQNIFIVYGVVFIIVTFMTKLIKKASRMDLESVDVAKSVVTMGICVAICFACSPIVNTLVNIGTGITGIVYDAIGKGQADVSTKLVNELGTTKLLYDDGEIIDWGKVITGYNETVNEDNEILINPDNTGVADKTVADTKNTLTDSMAQETFRYARMLCGILGGILFLILPTVISLGVNIFCLSFFIARIVELSVYIVFLPIPMADIYEHGLVGSAGGRHIRKIMALIFQGVVLYAMLALSQIFIGAIGVSILNGASISGGGFESLLGQMFSGLGSVTLYFIIIIVTDITMLTLAKKSLDISTNIAG